MFNERLFSVKVELIEFGRRPNSQITSFENIWKKKEGIICATNGNWPSNSENLRIGGEKPFLLKYIVGYFNIFNGRMIFFKFTELF